MASGVGLVGHFLSIWCNQHFRKSQNVWDKSCPQHPTASRRFAAAPCRASTLWCGFRLRSVLHNIIIIIMIVIVSTQRLFAQETISASMSWIFQPLSWVRSGCAFVSMDVQGYRERERGRKSEREGEREEKEREKESEKVEQERRGRRLREREI